MGSGSVRERSLTEFTLNLSEGFEMTKTSRCHSEAKRGIFPDPKAHRRSKLNHYPSIRQLLEPLRASLNSAIAFLPALR